MDLLTGATGFLGSHLAARLGRDRRKLRAIIRPGTDLRRIPREITEIVWGEIGEPETLRGALAGIDVVFHTAARVSGDRNGIEKSLIRSSAVLAEQRRDCARKRTVDGGPKRA
jgi:nucleoside-diphosphate-sugar epimerase